MTPPSTLKSMTLSPAEESVNWTSCSAAVKLGPLNSASSTLRRHIAVFAEYGWRNGGENSFCALANLLKNQFQFTVFCPTETELSEHLNDLQIECRDWRVAGQTGNRKSQSEIRREIKSLIERDRFDLVHSNSLSTARLVGPVARSLNVPAVGYLRDILKLSRQAIADINQCNRLIAVSDAARTFHVQQGLAAERCEVVYNGVDIATFRPCHQPGFLHRELGLNTKTKLVICVGQLGMRKGTEDVIAAFEFAQQSNPNLALAIIGMRNSQKSEAIEYEQRCRNRTARNPSVFWLGRRTDVAQIMADATLLVHGAKQEPLGRVLLESLAAGLPFIATDVGGTAEIVPTELRSVLLVPSGRPTELGLAAIRILNDTALQNEIAQDFRQRAAEQFSIERCAAKINQIYRELTA